MEFRRLQFGLRSVCALMALCGTASAQPKLSTNRSEVVFKGGGYFAHFCDGGGCRSLITIVNLEPVANLYVLTFRNDDGALQPVVTDGGTLSTFAGTLQPFESKTITTSGVALSQIQGWVDLTSPGIVGGSVMFRINLGQWINSEALVPIDFGYPRYLLTFNEADGSANGFAVTNPLSSTPLTVSVVIRDTTGQVIVTDSFDLPPRNHRSFVLNQRYPAAVGKVGSIDVSVPVGSTFSTWISVVGFRFGSNAVSTILPITSTAWFPKN